MRILFLAATAALALGACDSNRDAETNVMTADNLIDENAAMTGGPGGMDGNAATNSDTENLMLNDLTTNDADTNLANGL